MLVKIGVNIPFQFLGPDQSMLLRIAFATIRYGPRSDGP